VRAQTNTAQKCIGRSELTRVLKIMLDDISHGVRTFADEIRIQLFAVENLLSQNIASTPVFLRGPSVHTRWPPAPKCWLGLKIHQSFSSSELARNQHHLKYSQKTARQPNNAMYKQTQITTPLSAFSLVVAVSLL
jgi:hypothetical protein